MRHIWLLILMISMMLGYSFATATVTGRLQATSGYTPPSNLILTDNFSTIAEGQTMLFTANFIGGTPPYSYYYIISNAITGNIFTTQYYYNVPSTTNTFIWQPETWIFGNTFEAYVMVTDSNPTTISSGYLFINTTQFQVYQPSGGGGGSSSPITITTTTIQPVEITNTIVNSTKHITLKSTAAWLDYILTYPTKPLTFITFYRGYGKNKTLTGLVGIILPVWVFILSFAVIVSIILGVHYREQIMSVLVE